MVVVAMREEDKTFPDGTPKINVYPRCCTSAECGKGPDDCPTCPNVNRLRDFQKWKEETAAICTDRIWNPTVYEATRAPIRGGK
jgi:hypothetical protein